MALGIDGAISAVLTLDTSKFKAGLDEARTAGRSLSDYTLTASDRIAGLGRAMTSVGKTMTATITTAAVAAGTAATVTYASFEDAMLQVRAVSGATEEEYARLTEAAKEAGATTRFSASESANALNYMAMAGWNTQQMLDGLPGILNLAAASGADLATTSGIVTDALTAMHYGAADAGRMADVLAAASSNANTNVVMMGETFKYAASVAGTLGYSMEDVAIAAGLMANAGIKGEMAGTQLRSGMLRTLDPSAEMTAVMEQYGISIQNADGSMKSLSEVMTMYREKLGSLNEAEQGYAASVLFGQEASAGWLSIINASDEDFEKLTTAVYGATGAAESMAETMESGVAGSWRSLKSAAEGAMIEIGENLAPTIQRAIEGVTGLVRGFGQLDEGMQNTIITTAGIAAAAGPVLAIGGKLLTLGSKLAPIVKGLAPVLPILANPWAIGAAGVGLGAMVLPRMIDARMANVDVAYENLENMLDERIDGSVYGTITGEWDFTDAETGLQTGIDTLTSMASGIYGDIGTALTDGEADTDAVVGGLTSGVNAMFEQARAGINAMGGDTEGLTGDLATLEERTLAWINSMAGQSTEYVLEHMDELYEIEAEVDAILAKINGSGINTPEYNAVTSGVTTDDAMITAAANQALAVRSARLDQADTNARERKSEALEAWATGELTDADYRAIQDSIDEETQREKDFAQEEFEAQQDAILSGVFDAYDAADPQNKAAIDRAAVLQSGINLLQPMLAALEDDSLYDDPQALQAAKENLQSAIDGIYQNLYGEATPERYSDLSATSDFGIRASEVLEQLWTDMEAALNDPAVQNSGLITSLYGLATSAFGEGMDSSMEGIFTTIAEQSGIAGEMTVDGYANAIEDGTGEAQAAGSDMGAAALNGLRQAVRVNSPSRATYEIGAYMGQGLINGVASKEGALVSRMRSMASKAIRAAKDELGIASPSKVFREIGQYVGKGFALGIDDEQIVASNAMRGMVDSGSAKKAGTSVSNTYGGASYNISIAKANIRNADEARELLIGATKYTKSIQTGVGV